MTTRRIRTTPGCLRAPASLLRTKRGQPGKLPEFRPSARMLPLFRERPYPRVANTPFLDSPAAGKPNRGLQPLLSVRRSAPSPMTEAAAGSEILSRGFNRDKGLVAGGDQTLPRTVPAAQRSDPSGQCGPRRLATRAPTA